jgi:hypothetical protein
VTVRAFAGVPADTREPLVGEIVGLRTFRVDDSGLLLPLYSNEAWYDGPNTATCAPPTGDRNRRPHRVPDEACECGFYAYSGVEAARLNRQARYVQAVVSCWGGVIAGTQGIRAEHARIDAVWLHPAASPELRHRVAARYPSARMYTDATAMLAEHPTSRLGCYEPIAGRHPARSAAGAVVGAAVLALGLLPFDWLHRSPVLWAGWLLAVGGALVLTGWLALGAQSLGHLAAAVVMAGVLAFLLAPALGVPGWVLRLPLLRGLAAASLARLVRLRPHYFPVVRTPRPRAFCGVRA